MLPIRFIPHSVNLNTAGSVALWINQIENTNPEGGVTLFEETGGSEYDRQFVAAKDIMPTMPFVTSDLTVLTTCGISGVAISSGSGTPGLTAYARELPLESVPAPIGSSVHLAMTCSDGLLVPLGIQAGHNTVAKLNLELHGILGSGGTSGATPFVYAEDQTITSGAGATANIYTAGPVKWTVSGGSAQLLTGIKQLGCNFGIKVLKESDSGEVYPTHVSIIARDPKFEFTTADVEQIAAIGDGISVSAFAMYFRHVLGDGSRVPIATATHVSISATAGMITPGSLGLTHKKPGEAHFVFTPTLNTNIIVISATAAIPAS